MNAVSSHVRKAAILIASLDPQTADGLLRQMEPAHAQRVRAAVAALGDVAARERQDVIDEFLRSGSSHGVRVKHVSPHAGPRRNGPAGDDPNGVELDEGLRRRLAAGDEADDPPASSAPHGRPFEFLDHAETAAIAPSLHGEHPQTIALVVSHLSPQRAAEVLRMLGGPIQTEVVRRLVDLDGADVEVVRDVAQGLRARIGEQALHMRRRQQGVARLGTILHAADHVARRELIAGLQGQDNELANQVAESPWTFEDLQQLSDPDWFKLLAAAGADIATLALAGSPHELVERLLRGLPPQHARRLRQMMSQLGPTRLSDVETAQQRLVELAEQLDLQSRIRLRRDSRSWKIA